MRRFKSNLPAIRLALVYIILAGLWILFSDQVLSSLVSNPQELTRWQSIKGILFVLVMAFLLFAERSRAIRIHQLQEEIAQRHKTLFEQTPNPVFVIELEGMRIQEVNQTAQDLYGYSYDEFMHMRLGDLAVWLNQEDFDTLHALSENDTLMRDTRHKCKDGHTVDLQAIVRRINWKGQPAGLFVYTDVTARKQMEEEIRRIGSEFKAMVDASPLGIIAVDTKGTVYSWSRAAERIFGWSEEEALGKLLPFVPPEMQAESQEIRDQVIDKRSTLNVEVHRIRKDGTWVDLNMSLAPLLDGEDRITGVLGLVADITERKKSEEELRTTRELLTGLLRNAPLPIYVTNRDHQLLLVNHAWEILYGMQQADVTNKKLNEIFPQEPASMFVETNRQVLDTGRGVDTEDYIDLEDTRHYFRTIKFPLFGQANQVESVAGISMDVTERKKLLEDLYRSKTDLEERVAARTAELAAKNTELETFTYSVSHDLKAPLRGMDGYSRLLLEGYADRLDEEGRHFLEAIRFSSNQMSRLIDDLLTYSRLERRKFNLTPVDPLRLLDGILSSFAKEINDRNIRIEMDIPFQTVYHDPESLLQALQNLVDNAIKFTRNTPDAVVEIGGRETDTSQILGAYLRDLPAATAPGRFPGNRRGACHRAQGHAAGGRPGLGRVCAGRGQHLLPGNSPAKSPDSSRRLEQNG
jgi:PAS domain S-box-containing protein